MEILKIGCNSIQDKNFNISRQKGYNCYLFLVVKTPALFIIDGKEVNVESNSIILYDRNYPHYYSAIGENYINDWVQFNVESGTDYFKSLNIPLNDVIKIWDNTFICAMIKNISNEYYSVDPKKHEIMDLLLQTMFFKLSEIISVRNSQKHIFIHYSKLVSLREKIYSNPKIQWRVDILASEMNICSVYFQKIYKRTFGVSCVADVINCRMNYAKGILSKTNMPISSVAEECGYKNDVHFMRQFKKYVDVTPSEYRKNSFVNID
jgi:AraC family transcriptional regulator of arabinose operon